MKEGAGCGGREGAVVRFWFILKDFLTNPILSVKREDSKRVLSN